MCGVLINQTKLIVALGDDVGFEYLPHHAQRQAGGCPGAKVVCSGGMSAWAVGSLWAMGSALRPVADFSSSGSSGDSIFSSWAGAGCCARAVVTAGSALGCCSGRSGRMSSRFSCAVCGAGAANCGVLGALNGARTEFSSITPLVPGSVRAGTGAVSLFNARYSAAERVLKCFCGCGGWAGATAGR